MMIPMIPMIQYTIWRGRAFSFLFARALNNIIQNNFIETIQIADYPVFHIVQSCAFFHRFSGFSPSMNCFFNNIKLLFLSFASLQIFHHFVMLTNNLCHFILSFGVHVVGLSQFRNFIKPFQY